MKTISKRWIKNAVAIVVMLALCGSMFFTMSYAKSHAQASDMPQMSLGSDSSGGPGSGGTGGIYGNQQRYHNEQRRYSVRYQHNSVHQPEKQHDYQ